MLLIPPKWKASAERRDTPACSEVGVLGKHVVSSRLLACVAAASGRMRQNRGTAAVAIYRADVGNSRMRARRARRGCPLLSATPYQALSLHCISQACKVGTRGGVGAYALTPLDAVLIDRHTSLPCGAAAIIVVYMYPSTYILPLPILYKSAESQAASSFTPTPAYCVVTIC